MSRYIEDEFMYETVIENCVAAGLTPSQLRESTLRADLAVTAPPCDGVVLGALLARAWSCDFSGVLFAYIETEGSLVKVPFWHGSDEYNECIAIRPGFRVEASMKLSRNGRPYCTGIRMA